MVKTYKWKEKYKKIVRGGLASMKGPTFDPLSVIFFCHRIKVEPGKRYDFQVAANKHVWPMSLYVLGVEETELPGLGKRKCFRIKPRYDFQLLFERKKEGRVDLWVDCEWRVPAKLEAEVPIPIKGNTLFTVVLVKVEKIEVPAGPPENVPMWTDVEKNLLAPEPGRKNK